MNLLVMDTDVLTLLQQGEAVVFSHVAAHTSNQLCITVLTVEEQLSGWYSQIRKAKKRDRLAWAYRRLAENVRFLSQIQILDFDEPSIKRYEELRKLKLNIRKMDLRIAAIVLENQATLVTRNQSDFAKIPKLTLEDWSILNDRS